MSRGALLEGFLAFSAEATAFSVFELRGTGEAEAYLDTVVNVLGEEVVQALLSAHRRLEGSPAEREAQLRRDILGEPRLGPVARNIIKMWFVGVWYELPRTWCAAFGGGRHEGTFTVRPSAYTEGLLWKAIGANPPGAKSPGYGSWADPPRIPEPGKSASLSGIGLSKLQR